MDVLISEVRRFHGITVALMRTAIDFFTREMSYDVPAQDLRIDATRLPALPRSRFVISEIRSAVPAPADAAIERA